MALRNAFVSSAAALTIAAGSVAAQAEDGPEPTVSTESAETVTSTERVYSFNPLLPYAAIGGLGAAVLLLGGYSVARRAQGWPLRTAFGAAAVITLLNPEITFEERQPLTTEVVVVTDNSPSNEKIVDRRETTAAMKDEILTQLRAMPGINVRTVDVGGGNQGPDDGTKIFGAVEEKLADVAPDRVGAVIVLSDGQIHDVPGKPLTQMGGAPLHGLVSGKIEEGDRRVDVESPLYGVVDEEIKITFRVTDSGDLAGAGGLVPVTISVDGKVIETRDVIAGEASEVMLKVPHGGPNLIEVAAPAVNGELTEVNNHAVAQVEGIRDRLQVLLISGRPTYAERALRNLVKSDPAIDLIHFTVLRPPEKQDGTQLKDLALIPFPTTELFREDKLKEFDLVVLDRVQQNGTIYPQHFETLAHYVAQGGAMMVISGPEYAFATSIFRTKLNPALPVVPRAQVTEKPFYPHVSNDGAKHPVTRDLPHVNEGETPPWGRWTSQVEAEKILGGHVVMQGDGEKPLLILKRHGEGRVAQLMSDSSGLWARGVDGGGPYRDVFQRITHWLMQEHDLEEEALRMTAGKDGTMTVERQTMGDSVPEAILTAPSGETQTVTMEQAGPGLFRATVPVTETGLFRAEQGEMFASANVGPANPKEFVDPRSTPEVLKPLVTLTGGHIARMTDGAPELRMRDAGTQMTGPDMMGIRQTEASILKSASKYPLMAGWLALTAVLGALALAWHREGDGRFWPRKSGGDAPKAPGGPAP